MQHRTARLTAPSQCCTVCHAGNQVYSWSLHDIQTEDGHAKLAQREH